jgi:hypothetical protein
MSTRLAHHILLHVITLGQGSRIVRTGEISSADITNVWRFSSTTPTRLYCVALCNTEKNVLCMYVCICVCVYVQNY